MTAPEPRVGIVGGGMLGMTLALRMARAGWKATIFEAAAAPGGLAGPAAVGAYRWDRFYHVILPSDTGTLGLLDDIGMAGSVRWGGTRTGVYADGRLHSVSSTVEFLRFPALSLLGKARLAATILRASRIRDGEPLERVPVEDWLVRWSGRRTFEGFWRPLLRSKLGENYRVASAAFIWAIIARLYQARRSGMKRETLGYVEGGYEPVLRQLRHHLEGLGVDFRTGRPVEEVRGTPAGAVVRTGAGEERFDAAVLTLACPHVVRICPQLTPLERARLGRVVYQGVVCASMLLRRPLGRFYVTNITDEGLPFTGVIEMTALVDSTRFGGHTLVYLPRYLAQDDPWWTRTDQQVQEEFLAGLARMYPDLQASDVEAFSVSRARDVLAIATLDYTARAMPRLATSAPNVFIANSAQIANGTLNINETVTLANRQAALLDERRPGATGAARNGAGAEEEGPPPASISLDVDDLWSYLKTHGDPGWEQRPSYLDRFIPRAVEVLDRLDLRCTFFLVGADAERHAGDGLLRTLVREGHGVGNHSFEHEPWLHLYPDDRLDDEIRRADEAIAAATGVRPRGFRGPGFSWSPALVRVLADRGYGYDASTLPTFLGPLARAYYFATATLTPEERERRKALFGGFREGFRPLKPYRWTLGGRAVLEIPVTTVPVIRTPFHLSYLIYLSRFSEGLMRAYLAAALRACRLAGVAPSFLLHPLDLLGGDEVPALRFFPGMDLDAARKTALFERVLRALKDRFTVVDLDRYAGSLAGRRLKEVAVDPATAA